MGDNVTMETRADCAFSHHEADVTMVSYVIQAASHSKSVIRVLSDDTVVFCFIGLLGAQDGKMGWGSAGHQCTCADFGKKNAFSSLVYMPLVDATQYRIHRARVKPVHSTPCSLETSKV